MHIGNSSKCWSPVCTTPFSAVRYRSTTALFGLRTLGNNSRVKNLQLNLVLARGKAMSSRDFSQGPQLNKNLQNDIQRKCAVGIYTRSKSTLAHWVYQDYERHGLDMNTRTKFASQIQDIVHRHAGSRFDVKDVSMYTCTSKMLEAPLEFAIVVSVIIASL
jgi:hypothetical protein